MFQIRIDEVPPGQLPTGDIVGLYSSVGWTVYANDVDTLRAAIGGSSFVVAAHGQDGALVGMARAISDGVTICYLQDVLVDPAAQRQGLGRALVTRVLDRYKDVRQFVLLTDDEPAQRAFYEGMGLREISEVEGGPLRAFVRIGN